jgi:hypothetical protein
MRRSHTSHAIGLIVDARETTLTVAAKTKGTARSMKLHASRQDLLPAGKHCERHGLALHSLKRPTVKRDGYRSSGLLLLVREDGGEHTLGRILSDLKRINPSGGH